MIGLSKGQEISAKLKVWSKMGSGILYLLNTGISFEISGKGIALELNYDELTLVKEIKKESILISWKENTETYDIEFNLKNASEVAQKIIRYQNERLAR
ncbi:MAG: hypothetical protein KGI27_11040 [Thaumarchaeota archaeon]|nr:hypothetical protein [Nitrososphaerota archaeon]